MKFRAYNARSFKKTEYYQRLPIQEQEIFDVLTSVFQFKANNYVLDHLIDWNNIPEDPMYKLVFPRKEMIGASDYEQLRLAYEFGLEDQLMQTLVQQLKRKMYPETKQAKSSVPRVDGKVLKGMYRNFRTIVSLFPDPMVKTCHTYCSYCFRWPSFNNKEMQDESSYQDPMQPVAFLKAHPEISDVLFTGADPLVLKADTLRKYIEPILDIPTVKVIRISSKSLAWWPFRFTTDDDAASLLDLFREIQEKGKHLNFCAHFTHPKELEHEAVQEAIKNVRETGAIIRCQGPLVKGINDNATAWVDLWTVQIMNGMIPYYMFVEADHNPEHCFRVSLLKALKIFQEAQRNTTGLARTVRGPVFMNDLNRVLIEGVSQVDGKDYLILKNLQGPPGLDNEGVVKLIPYHSELRDAGDLYALFNEASDEISVLN